MLGDKSYLSFFGKRRKGDHSIRKKGVVNKICCIEKKLAWNVEKTRGVRANREFNKK